MASTADTLKYTTAYRLAKEEAKATGIPVQTFDQFVEQQKQMEAAEKAATTEKTNQELQQGFEKARRGN